ncbi:MAG: type IV toxin-antitoxin system AbiEi family antitoxin domain-containing protein [Chloroflexota bacterium]
MEARPARPNLRELDELALAQGGYFDRADAQAHGISDRLVHHYTRTGRFERVFPGVYRLAIAPLSPHDDLLQAWVWSNYRGAISHESALALYGLSDILPSRVQITVPPGFGRRTDRFDVHRSDLPDKDTGLYEGMRVTTPARSIADAAAAGTGPEQIQLAVAQAIARGLASPAQLRRSAGRPRYRHRRTVRPLIEGALAHAHP